MSGPIASHVPFVQNYAIPSLKLTASPCRAQVRPLLPLRFLYAAHTATPAAVTVKHDKETFRRYLENTGVVDSLSKALVRAFFALFGFFCSGEHSRVPRG